MGIHPKSRVLPVLPPEYMTQFVGMNAIGKCLSFHSRSTFGGFWFLVRMKWLQYPLGFLRLYCWSFSFASINFVIFTTLVWILALESSLHIRNLFCAEVQFSLDSLFPIAPDRHKRWRMHKLDHDRRPVDSVLLDHGMKRKNEWDPQNARLDWPIRCIELRQDPW